MRRACRNARPALLVTLWSTALPQQIYVNFKLVCLLSRIGHNIFLLQGQCDNTITISDIATIFWHRMVQKLSQAPSSGSDTPPPQKKDWFRRQGKGRPVGLGDRILAALAVLPLSFWNKWLNSIICFKKTEIKQLARQAFCPLIRRNDLRLVF